MWVRKSDVCTTQFSGFLVVVFCFVFLLFYAIWPCMLSVQCIISQTALTGLLQFWVSAGRHRGTGPMSLRQQVGQNLQVRKTAIGQLWPPLTDGYYELNAVGSGRPACCSMQSLKLGHHGTTTPNPHFFMDSKKIYRFIYIYIHIYVYICVCVYVYIYIYK